MHNHIPKSSKSMELAIVINNIGVLLILLRGLYVGDKMSAFSGNIYVGRLYA